MSFMIDEGLIRQKHQSLFARGRVALVDFFIQDPTELAAFVHDCCEACKE